MGKNSNNQQSRGFFSKLLRFFKWCAYTTLLLVAIVGFTGLGFYYYISKDLPNLTKISDYQPPVMAEVYDDEGKKVGEFWTEARILTPVDKVPQKLIEAFVSSEDDRFFEHRGVDPYGIVRAFIRNLKAGQVVQGASTITQQVTKALLLSPERTYERKIKEAILATRIEKNLTKDQILYIYLNQIYFGNRAYGVAAAARNYFHKDLQDLNLAEMALIAGLAKAPSLFNPVVNPIRAKQRMSYVLDRMAEEGYVTRKEAEAAKKAKLHVYKAKTDKEFNYQYAPFFVEEVRRELVKKYGTEKLYTSGWKIYTTLNLEMNDEAQQAVIKGISRYSKSLGYRGPI
ncbi:MAG: transglycosylase domain-containing protein, partial [bacterium]|nr:transglycosylase domain-containing protein [bacterium]